MPATKSPLAFNDAKELLDRALAAERGIKVTLESHGKAMRLRSRMNDYRARDRRDSMKIYPEDHPKYGVSEYDTLELKIDKDSSELVVTKRSAEYFHFEEL